MEQRVSITVNGEHYVQEVPIRMLLVDLIRERIGLTGTHIGCTYEGKCGACTVVLNGDAVKSCMVLAVQADGAVVVTPEGLDQLGPSKGELHPIQEGFWKRNGLQCGYCTPGMMMTVFDLLKSELDSDSPDLSDENIRHALVGNICRCTGYTHIIEAVRTAAERLLDMPPEERRSYFETAGVGGDQS